MPKPKNSPTTEAKKRAGAKGGRSRSPAKKTTARENGELGGRPKKQLNNEVFKAVKKPPTHPLKLARWVQRVLALDMWSQISGQYDRDRSSSLRATATAISRIMPADIVAEALRLLNEDEGKLTGDGPTVEEVTDGESKPGGSLSCSASRG